MDRLFTSGLTENGMTRQSRTLGGLPLSRLPRDSADLGVGPTHSCPATVG
jgi:hypothetical protein